MAVRVAGHQNSVIRRPQGNGYDDSSVAPNMFAGGTHGPRMKRKRHGGRGIITGTVKVTPNTPIKARVFIYGRRSADIVDETVSDAVTGAYTFSGLSLDRQFFTIALHPTKAYNLEGADALDPDLMPLST